MYSFDYRMGTFFYFLFSGQLTVQLAQSLKPSLFSLLPQEQPPLPFCMTRMAPMTRTRTTSSTMTVGAFMR